MYDSNQREPMTIKAYYLQTLPDMQVLKIRKKMQSCVIAGLLFGPRGHMDTLCGRWAWEITPIRDLGT